MTSYIPLPMTSYLRTDAGGDRKNLHKAAFSRRCDHWSTASTNCGLETARAEIETRFGTSIEGLRQRDKDAALQFDIQLAFVLDLEARLNAAPDEPRAMALARAAMAASCTLAEYEVALHVAQAALRKAEALLGGRQSRTEAMYEELLAADEIVQLRERVRVALEDQRHGKARKLMRKIGATPSSQLRRRILAADLGEYEKAALKALALHEDFKRAASFEARQLVRALTAGMSPYLDEAPRETRRFIATGSFVRAVDARGRTVARWAVTPLGGAHLLAIVQPRGTQRIRRRDGEVRAYDHHGRVLGRFPLTAHLFRPGKPHLASTAA